MAPGLPKENLSALSVPHFFKISPALELYEKALTYLFGKELIEAYMNDIEYILSPKSIAVVGASNRTGSLGLSVFRNLIDASYQGILYPVNPKARSIQGVTRRDLSRG